MKKADPPLLIQIPSASGDQPSWMRVGAIAVIGFAVGIAWPRLAGVRLGPNAPASASPASPASESPGKPAAASIGVASASLVAPVAPPPSASAAAAAAAASTAAAPAPAGGGNVTVGAGILLSCRTQTGETLKGKACGPMPFDAIALPRLRRMATCPAATGAEGRFSPKFQLDFERNKLTVQLGTRNTVPNVDSFSTCLAGLFDKVSINAVAHEHARYLLQYNVVFSAAGGASKPSAIAAAGGAGSNPPPAAAPTPTPSQAATAAASGGGGEAKIAWDVAIVRDAPRTGSIVGRIPRGADVKIIATENNWYKVRGDSAEGWLYRGAIGR